MAEIVALGGKAIAVQGDLDTPAEVEALVAGTLEAFGGIDVLVNNAGGLIARKTIAAMSLAHRQARVRQALAGMPHLRSGLGRDDTPRAWRDAVEIAALHARNALHGMDAKPAAKLRRHIDATLDNRETLPAACLRDDLIPNLIGGNPRNSLDIWQVFYRGPRAARGRWSMPMRPAPTSKTR